MHTKTAETWLTSWQKRADDIAIASALAPLLSPFVVLAAGAIVVTEREPPFIVQERYGRGGQPLKIAKLRTMPHGTRESMSNGHYDERRTRLGRKLSASRLDEMPQLWNVLRGNMSMVGLRPLVTVHHDEFLASLPKPTRDRVDMAYHIAKPGWFDPYGVDLYVKGVEDTHEARAESIIKYVFEDASHKRDYQIMFEALGIVKNLVGDSGVDLLPLENPPLSEQD